MKHRFSSYILGIFSHLIMQNRTIVVRSLVSPEGWPTTCILHMIIVIGDHKYYRYKKITPFANLLRIYFTQETHYNTLYHLTKCILNLRTWFQGLFVMKFLVWILGDHSPSPSLWDHSPSPSHWDNSLSPTMISLSAYFINFFT